MLMIILWIGGPIVDKLFCDLHVLIAFLIQLFFSLLSYAVEYYIRVVFCPWFTRYLKVVDQKYLLITKLYNPKFLRSLLHLVGEAEVTNSIETMGRRVKGVFYLLFFLWRQDSKCYFGHYHLISPQKYLF